jgi:hypothetical protein
MKSNELFFNVTTKEPELFKIETLSREELREIYAVKQRVKDAIEALALLDHRSVFDLIRQKDRKTALELEFQLETLQKQIRTIKKFLE